MRLRIQQQSIEEKARRFAVEAHKGQYRKDGITPYVEHPIRVVNRLNEIGILNQDILCAGYLHDVIEDCGVSVEFLEKEFNSNIARIVLALTRNVGRQEYNERIRNSDYSVQIIKIADTVDNCLDINFNISEKTIIRKIDDCEELYLDLAKQICPYFHELLSNLFFKIFIQLKGGKS